MTKIYSYVYIGKRNSEIFKGNLRHCDVISGDLSEKRCVLLTVEPMTELKPCFSLVYELEFRGRKIKNWNFGIF